MTQRTGLRHRFTEVLRIVSRVDRARIDWVRAFRLATVVGAALATGILTDHRGSGVACATAAVLASFADTNDPYPVRARMMGATTLTLAAVAGLGALATHGPWLLVGLAAALAAVAAGAARFGPRAATLGRLSLSIYAAYAVGLLGTRGVLASALLVGVGAGALTLLSLTGWLLGTSQDLRATLGHLWRDMSVRLAESPQALLAGDIGERAEKLERQSDALHPEQLAVWTRRVIGDAQAVRLSMVDYLTVRAPGAVEPPAVARVRSSAATATWWIGRSITTPGFGRVVHRSIRRAREACDADTDPSSEPEREALIRALNDATVAIAGRPRYHRAGSLPGRVFNAGGDAPDWLARHTVRMVTLYVAATIIGYRYFQPHGGWLPLTVAMLLLPAYADTIHKTVGRILGTAGAVLLGLTAAFLLPPHMPWLVAALATVMALVAGAVADANYPLRVLCITAVMTSELALQQQDLVLAMEERIGATILAAAMVILASLVYPLRKAPEFARLLAEASAASEELIANVRPGMPRTEIRTFMRQSRHCRDAAGKALESSWAEHHTGPVTPRSGETVLEALSLISLHTLRFWLDPQTPFDRTAEQQALSQLTSTLREAAATGELRPPEVVTAWTTSPDSGVRNSARALRALGARTAAPPA